jgi:DNA-binding LytR/AlgR family response regulator
VDVFLADGEATGFELAARLAALPEPPAVILISSHDGAEFETLARESRARGFVPKAQLSRAAIEELRP